LEVEALETFAAVSVAGATQTVQLLAIAALLV